jgi:hypothetical protein
VLVLHRRPVLVAILVLIFSEHSVKKMSWLAALEACPCDPPCVHLVLMQPLEPFGQQHQLVLSR